MLVGVVNGVIDADHDGRVGVLAWRRDEHLAGAALEVERRVVAGAELASGLHDDVHAEAAPVDGRRVPRGQHSDGLAVDGDRVAGVPDRRGQPAIGGVELEQMRERTGIGDVVDGDDVQVTMVQRAPDESAANPAEAVNADSDRHYLPSPRS